MLYRQGDIYIQRVAAVPAGVIRLPDLIIAEGELTGHRHRIDQSDGAALFELRGRRFLVVTDEHVDLMHDEHDAVRLDRGTYRVWRQREFDPADSRRSRIVTD